MWLTESWFSGDKGEGSGGMERQIRGGYGDGSVGKVLGMQAGGTLFISSICTQGHRGNSVIPEFL